MDKKFSELKIIPTKAERGRCIVGGCRGRSEKGKGGLCFRHAMQKFKESRPETYYFNNLKQNAKRRGHEFNLTLEEFKIFCHVTGYLKGKGRSSSSLSIDRIDPSKGYQLDNIQVLTNSDNLRKRYGLESRGVAFERSGNGPGPNIEDLNHSTGF